MKLFAFCPSWLVVPVLLGSLSPSLLCARPDHSELVYVGSGHQDIYGFWLNVDAGTLEPIGRLAHVDAPSFLAVSPNKRYVYAISEGSTPTASTISAFERNTANEQLNFINARVTGGTGPCFVEVDRIHGDVLVANYTSGSASVFPTLAGGFLGEMSGFAQDKGSSVNAQRQEGPHAHCIITDPDDRFAFVCDLGLDKVMIFRLDASGRLTPNDPASAPVKPGSGPRHIAFTPNSRFAYVANELVSTVSAFAYNKARGSLTPLADYPMLPADFTGQNYAAEIAVHPSGRFVYASNRGHDSIAVYAVDRATGALTLVERAPSLGKFPRSFAMDRRGRYMIVAGQDSGSLYVFSIDPKTGALRPTGGQATADRPMCVVFPGLAK
jgi:6-phosphogluconolactonase